MNIINEMQRLAGIPLTENVLQGRKFVHETTKEYAKQIIANGFREDTTGTFFSYIEEGGASYTGEHGSWGGSYIYANLNIPDNKVLDLEEEFPEDLEEESDGNDIANYCHAHGYWAWTDGYQVAVFNVKSIQITSSQINCCVDYVKYSSVLKTVPIKYCPFCRDPK